MEVTWLGMRFAQLYRLYSTSKIQQFKIINLLEIHHISRKIQEIQEASEARDRKVITGFPEWGCSLSNASRKSSHSSDLVLRILKVHWIPIGLDNMGIAWDANNMIWEK